MREILQLVTGHSAAEKLLHLKVIYQRNLKKKKSQNDTKDSLQYFEWIILATAQNIADQWINQRKIS